MSELLAGALRAVIIFGAVMSLVPMLVLAERRIAAWIQNRVGPNRVGPQGLLQPLADILKLAFKEEIVPAKADRVLYMLGPFLAFAPAMLAFAVIPVARGFQVSDMNIGVLFVITVTSLGVYGISFGGWASNSKNSLLGGLRSSAQIISYEIAMGLALVSIIMVSGSVHLGAIVENQGDILHWNVFRQPLAFLIFLAAAFAENNRLPFDLPECEAELVGGYHTEYSGMKFAVYFLAEYVAMIVMSSLIVTLFLGGWNPGFPLPQGAAWTLLSAGAFTLKVLLVLFLYMWVRWTLPRFRYDQLMKLGWKGLLPLAMGNIVVTGIVTAIWDAISGGSA
jgi:NADH-quinone oxidoreductase subunit H